MELFEEGTVNAVAAPYFGRPGAATQLNYSATNPGYVTNPQVAIITPDGIGLDATMAWGEPYDLSGGSEAPARGEAATKEALRASGLI